MDLLNVYDDSSDEDIEEDLREAAIDDENRTETRSMTPGTVQVISQSAVDCSSLFARSVPHTRGNWAGHVFMKLSDDVDLLENLAERSTRRFRTKLERAGWSGTIVTHYSHQQAEACPSGLHLSLSRPFFLQLTWIPSFVDMLQNRLSLERSTILQVQTDSSEKLLVNDERTRSFWCWPITATAALLRLVSHVDTVLQSYKQPTYYSPPKFHVSVASVVGDVSEVLTKRPEETDEPGDGSFATVVMSVPCVYCSFGTTKLYKIDLMP